MILSDKKIKEYIKSRKIVVEPFDESLVGPASLDVRLGFKFRVFKNINVEAIDIKSYKEDVIYRSESKDYTIHHGTYSDLIIVKGENIPIIVHPGEFVLASVYEYIELSRDIAAQINGRSSIGRLGLLVHTSAGWIDPGYAGHLTLEIYNVNKVPVKLYPLTKIAQIVFYDLGEGVEVPYGERKSSKYFGEDGATESRISEDYK
ncbi:dCTP deaminase [Nanoarchaeota archaeon NZ13-N]|nr:MAG: dCTP deaminase [Nanoarchaeota archaeon NZ13-N]